MSHLSPPPHRYATMFKAISTGLKIHSFMYLIFLYLLLKKVALLFCPGEAGKPPRYFQRLTNKIQGLSRTTKNSKTFPGCVNPVYRIVGF